ncbi:hypothetical protein ACX3T3_09165 [Actinotignum schaalii]|nr:hypothetical protein [Actinotignum schaalii]MDE1536659.1 hypothetical protein [Actinotignum schaalii]MDY5144983.1 hypothetical protein [Actinotignum timonense]
MKLHRITRIATANIAASVLSFAAVGVASASEMSTIHGGYENAFRAPSSSGSDSISSYIATANMDKLGRDSNNVQRNSVSPDRERSIRYVENVEATPRFVASLVDGDTLTVDANGTKISWRDKYGVEVAYLDATNGGATPNQFFVIEGNVITIIAASTRAQCGKSYFGQVVFGLAWAGGVCGPMHLIPALGIACDAVTIIGAPIINWDSVC